MKQLSKGDIARRDRIAANLEAAYDRLRDAWSPLQEAVTAYNAVVDRYNEALNEARGWVDDMGNAIEAAISEKSERWQESDTGQAVQEWRDSFDQDDLTEIDHIDLDNDEPGEENEALDKLTGFADSAEGA